LTAKQAPAGHEPPRRSEPERRDGRRHHPTADLFKTGEAAMWLSSILCWPKMTRKPTPRGRPERGPSRRPRRTCRPTLEALEDRAVPAIFNVAAGDVPGLIAALDKANKNGQVDIINLAPGAPYTLTAPGPSPLAGARGLTMLADGGNLLTLNGNGATIARAVG